ncbi:MAG: TniQ family protein [Candidatus Heimdallarchaeota archaeon]|nr:TniQ family protein [Candidatus Heimdallarchaeota archaeon]
MHDDIWPIRPSIQPFESISSWIKRISEKYLNDIPHLLKLNSMRNIYEDIYDLDPSEDILSFLSKYMDYDITDLRKHTLAYYDNHFPDFIYTKKTSLIRKLNKLDGFNATVWLTPPFFEKYNAKWKSQNKFCTFCLKEEIPYYKIYWRFTFYNACHIHNVLLLDRCGTCNSKFRYFKNGYKNKQKITLDKCPKCLVYLHNSKTQNATLKTSNILLSIFFEKASPLKNMDSTTFLGIFWKIFSLILRRNEDYLQKIFDKYGYRYEKEMNHLLRNYYLTEISYRLAVEHQSINELIPCLECNKMFGSNGSLTMHLKYVHTDPKLKCDKCGQLYTLKTDLKYHKKRVHYSEEINCVFSNCDATFPDTFNMTKHLHKMHSEDLKVLIIQTIEELNKKKKNITFAEICRITRIPVTVFEKHKFFYLIVRPHLDKRHSDRYIKLPKLTYEERNSHYENLTKSAIEELMQSDLTINTKNVFRKTKYSCATLNKYPSLRILIEKYRKQQKLSRYIKRVLEALNYLKVSNIPISYSSISTKTKIAHKTLMTYQEIRELIKLSS